MCFFKFLLMYSSIVASVVDFPLPVGPQTKTKPFSKFAIFVKISGKSALSNSGIVLFNCLNDAEIPFLVLNTFTLYLV